jgi:hypothetical protein
MKKLIICLAFFLTAVSLVFPQNGFMVNTYTDSTQRDPQIAEDSEGNFVVVWDSENQISSTSQSDLYFQKFNSNNEKVGVETLINESTSGEQEKPALAMNPSGDFIVAWASHTGDFESIFDVKAKIYKSTGETTTEFLVNTYTDHSQTNPEVAAGNDGKFVVVWESWNQDGSDRGIYGQIFDSDGNKIGSEVQVNSTTLYSQARPAVKFFDNGNFIVVWESWNQDASNPSGYGIYCKIFDAGFSTVADEFQANTYTSNYQWFGNLEVFDDNSFVVVWCSWTQDGHDGGIYMQKFDAAANMVGNEIRVNKTTTYYQWLPQIKDAGNGSIAVVWSSWQQDGSREGVYAQLFDSNFNKISFETRINDVTEGYQWEPVFITKSEDEILVIYSDWDPATDYEIVGKQVKLVNPQGSILPNSYGHTSGNSSTRIHVYVVDSMAVTGDNYEVSFQAAGEEGVMNAYIENITSGIQITSFPIFEVPGGSFLSETFEGVRVEVTPEFEFKLDTENSYFINNSGTNITFQTVATSNAHLAPIDVWLIWGNTDTSASGNYLNPLYSAYSLAGVQEIECPFTGWNETDGELIELFITENSGSTNNRWDPGEKITIITPLQYNPVFPRFHAALNSSFPAGAVVLPNEGDTNVVLTKRPLTEDDTYTFQTAPSLITGYGIEDILPLEFRLEQNYPNPFNPSTTINFTIPSDGTVKLTLFNVLGEQVASLFEGVLERGFHRIEFNASNLASGVYIYAVEFENLVQSKKMMLLK